MTHYEDCLKRHGPTPAGADWPNPADLAVRFDVMLELLDGLAGAPALLDLGCGPGLLLDHLAARDGVDRVRYTGIDLSGAMVETARSRWPNHQFHRRDIIAQPLPAESVDVVIMNGVLTERVSLSFDAMAGLAREIVSTAFRCARIGIAFNVMNAHVDWERPDLFHWAFDDVARFLRAEVSPHYAFRADYGLYEYTCFVFRRPRTAGQSSSSAQPKPSIPNPFPL